MGSDPEKSKTEVPVPVPVLVFAPFYRPAFRGGGPIQTLGALIDCAPEQVTVSVVTRNHDLGDDTPLVDSPNSWVQVGNARVAYLSRSLIPVLRVLLSSRRSRVIYCNSFFSFKFAIIPYILFSLRFWPQGSLLVAPRGELSPGALSLKSRKKQIFISVFRRLGLVRDVVWHASTELERSEIIAELGSGARVIVRENETALPSLAVNALRKNETFSMLFVSRLSEKKGLHILLDALASTRLHVRLDIVGEFESASYQKSCENLAEALPSSVEVVFHGAKEREDVLLFMDQSDVLVLPTAGENFGHVIAESLSRSCPVWTSDFTPWSDLLNSGGGRVISPNTAEEWSKQFNDVLSEAPTGGLGTSFDLAGTAYNRWKGEDKGEHVFAQVLE